jgi:hypothetical protein
MTVTGEGPENNRPAGEMTEDDERWPEDGAELPPPPEVAEPEFDDEASGGEFEGDQQERERQLREQQQGNPGAQ